MLRNIPDENAAGGSHSSGALSQIPEAAWWRLWLYSGRAGIPNDERDKKQSAGQGSQFTQEPSVIIASFGKENLVWEDFTLLLKNSFE